MLKFIGYILLLSLIVVIVKLIFSFTIAMFAFTITAIMCGGTITFILSVLGVMEADTAWLVFGCAVGIGFLYDIVRFLKDPGEIFSDTKDNFYSSSNVGGGSHSDSSSNDSDDTDYPYKGDQYRKCCGSCRWLSSHGSHNSVCTLNGREVCHSDYCSDWQS